MTAAELYDTIGGDYQEVLKRLPTDALVARFVVKFLDDSSCKELVAAWDAHDEGAAFHAAHTAKGVCANLGLTKLCDLSTEICEALRDGNDELRASTDVEAKVRELEAAYATTVENITTFRDQ